MANAYRMGLWDYVALCAVVLTTSLPGLYQVYRARRAKSTKDFLVTGSGLGLLPIALSMMAGSVSGSAILGVPGDFYRYGVGMFAFALGILPVIPVVCFLFVPVFFNLSRVSIFDYMERRFNRSARKIFSCMVNLKLIFLASINIYSSSIALNMASDLDIWYCVVVITILCVGYTSLGGFRAVVWTDVMQVLVCVAALLVVLIKGLLDHGGFKRVWKLNQDGNRTTLFMWEETTMQWGLTIWPILLGAFFIQSIDFSSQTTIQRYWAAGNISRGKRVVSLALAFLACFLFAQVAVGFLAFAQFRNCDPLRSGRVKTRDQEVVLLVSEMFSNAPGFLGFFFASIFCGTISSVSSLVNGSVCMILDDIVMPLYPGLSDIKLLRISKILGLVCGLVCMVLILIIQMFPGILSITFIVKAVFGGPIFGVFVLGMMSPWTNYRAAFTGCFVAMLFILWVAIGKLITKPILRTAALTTDGCNTSFSAGVWLNRSVATTSATDPNSDIFSLYTYHPYWYPCWSVLLTIGIGLAATVVLRPQPPDRVDHSLLFPCVVSAIRKLPADLRERLGFAKEQPVDPTSTLMTTVKTATGGENPENIPFITKGKSGHDVTGSTTECAT